MPASCFPSQHVADRRMPYADAIQQAAVDGARGRSTTFPSSCSKAPPAALCFRGRVVLAIPCPARRLVSIANGEWSNG